MVFRLSPAAPYLIRIRPTGGPRPFVSVGSTLPIWPGVRTDAAYAKDQFHQQPVAKIKTIVPHGFWRNIF
jgi:hypothetical protein